MNLSQNEWMNGRMNEWINEWMDEWMNEWIFNVLNACMDWGILMRIYEYPCFENKTDWFSGWMALALIKICWSPDRFFLKRHC
jgi:hypothetical protein